MTPELERPPALPGANAQFVTDRLAVGGDLDMYDEGLAARQVAALTNAGISHVLDVREEWSDEEIWAQVPGVTYHWDGIDDAGQRVPVDWFEGIVTWALSALEDPAARILAHCHMGINRGPSAGFAILLGLGWEPIEALDAIRRARPIAFVAYADDALRWHHAKTGANAEERLRDRARLEIWRHDHDLDIATVIRRIRTQEGQ
ncbi:MAG: dual specificity protein phosphatase [Marmoricola sp.]